MKKSAIFFLFFFFWQKVYFIIAKNNLIKRDESRSSTRHHTRATVSNRFICNGEFACWKRKKIVNKFFVQKVIKIKSIYQCSDPTFQAENGTIKKRDNIERKKKKKKTCERKKKKKSHVKTKTYFHFDGGEWFAIVDTNNGTNHLWHNNGVAQMCFNNLHMVFQNKTKQFLKKFKKNSKKSKKKNKSKQKYIK